MAVEQAIVVGVEARGAGELVVERGAQGGERREVQAAVQRRIVIRSGFS